MTVVGGGTIVVPSLSLGRRSAERALLLHRAGLAGIRREGGRITIGATTTLDALGDVPEPLRTAVPTWPTARSAARRPSAATSAPRCPTHPRGDLQGPLIALGAQVRSTGAGGERTEAIEDFLPGRATGSCSTSRSTSPRRAPTSSSTARTPTTTPPLAVSRRHGPRTAPSASASPASARTALLDLAADDTDDLPFADDALASAWYRKRTLPVLVRRALTSSETRMRMTVNGAARDVVPRP